MQHLRPALPLRFWFAALTCLLGVTWLSAQTHPFIIVKESDYPALQALSVGASSRAPFIRMRTDAMSIPSYTSYDTSASVSTRSISLIKIMDSTALAYIVDPANRAAHRDRFYTYLKYWDLTQPGNITKDLNINDWNACVPPTAAFFATIVAMDIIYNDPATTAAQILQRDNFNAMMETPGNAWTSTTPGTMGAATWIKSQYEPYHLESLMSARALWALWKDGLVNNTALNDAVTVYKDHWRDHITDDGCYREFGGYGLSRAGDPSRYNKGVFHDIIVYTGIDPAWYSDPKMSKFYEWIGGYSLLPNRHIWPLGDSSYAPQGFTYASPFDRASKFSTLGGSYGEWQQNGAVPAAKLFSYLVRARTPVAPVAQAPASRIFADGAAYLLQKNGGVNSLAAVLTNLKTTTVPNLGHLHRSTNSLSIASLGEILLRAPGYNGFDSPASATNNFGFNFAYVNNHAISQNVALFNYSISNYLNPTFTNEHRAKHGGYGLQGLLTDTLDYATGDTGALTDGTRAINNGRHNRHVVAVYPQDGVNGYVYSIDELEGSATGTGQLAWHPYSSTITVNADNTGNDRYEWQIRQKANTTDQLYLSIFMPTAPDAKQQYDGLFADDIQGGASTSFVGRYIFNSYNLNASTKKRNVLTMFFPRKSTQAVPTMERITATGTGGVTSQAAAFAFDGGVTDFSFESDGTGERTLVSPTYDATGAAARGKAVVYRKINSALAFYFVGKGRSFKNTPTGFTRGFVSDADVDIHMKGNTGSIVSPGTAITFYTSGTPAARLNGTLVTPLSSGAGFVRVSVPAGTHTLALEPASGANTAPTVSIPTAPSSITLPVSASLIGTAADDGLPVVPGALTLAWTKQSGPGTVSFTAPSSLSSTATFSVAGSYLLRLSASDGELSSFAEARIEVAANTGAEQVIYRETFGNTSGADVRFNSPTISWQHYTAATTGANVADSSGSNGGADSRNGRPANLDNVNAGTSASQVTGYAYSLNARQALVFTTEFPVNRSIYTPTALSWYSHLSNNNSGANNQSPAVRIGGQWYVITLSTDIAGNFTQLGGGASFDQSGSLFTVNFATATATSATGVVTSGWRTLAAAPNAPFVVGTTAVALPSGNIEAFGVYLTTAGNCSARFDSFELKATAGPLTSTTTLSSGPNPAVSGSSVTLSATVSVPTGTPTGTVVFSEGATTLGSAPLSVGAASLTLNSLTLGNHSLTARYSGDGNYSASNSPPLTQAITVADGTIRVLAIDCNGPANAATGFAADTGFTSSNTGGTSNAIDRSAVVNAAPEAVYQTERYGAAFTYTFGGLTASASYQVRIHCSENYWGLGGRTGPGQRLLNVSINGTQRLASFDIYATVGASNKAVIREFLTTANASGQIVLAFAAAAGSPDGNAAIHGIEAYTTTPSDAWRATHFTPAQFDDPGASGLTADPDGDGAPNLLEYALATNPNLVSGPFATWAVVTTSLPEGGTQDSLALSFFRARADLDYTVQSRSDLSGSFSWQPIITNPGVVGTTVTVPDTEPIGIGRRFLRLQVAKP